jgi:hypothetical protein
MTLNKQTKKLQASEKNHAQAVKEITGHINYRKGATLVPGTLKLLHQRKKKLGCRLDLKLLLMRVDNSAGKGTSGMNKFGSIIERMNMKLGSKFLNSLKNQDAAP